MLRKNIRLRKEYLHKIDQENKLKSKYQAKLQIKMADAARQNIPTELYGQEDDLRKDLQREDDNIQSTCRHPHFL